MVFHSIHNQNSIKTHHAVDGQHSWEDWEVAQERILLYLKCMHIPPGEDRLVLAWEALRHANRDQGKVDSITPSAVRIARTLVKEYYETFNDNPQMGRYTKKDCDAQPKRIWSIPPLNRGRMTSIEFHQIPVWLTTESFLKKLIIQLRPLMVPMFILLNLLLLLGLFLTRTLS